MTIDQAKILTSYRKRKEQSKCLMIALAILAFVWLFGCFLLGYSESYLKQNHNKGNKHDSIQQKHQKNIRSIA